MNKFYITTPIYYASGKPHLGHAFSALCADVIARAQRKKGKEVFFVSGMDEHGAKIAQKAQLEKINPQEFVDNLSDEYVDAWAALNIKYSDFIRTTSVRHKKGAQEFFKKIIEAGDIYDGVYEGLYCVGCENFVLERNLENGLCPDHKTAPEKIKEKNRFFNLKKYLPQVKEKILSNELKITPTGGRNEAIGIIDGGIDDFSITRESVKWGIPFPGDESQTIYVWAEALTNYLTVLDFPSGEKFEKYWPADLHIIGAEINKFHTVFWPALLLSAGLPLPKEIFIHGLLTVNGQKMSKTVGNVIDPMEIVKRFGTDAARYLLLSQFPASEHGDVRAEEFVSKYNSDLANGVGNLFERSLTMIKDFRNGKINKDSIINKEIEKAAEVLENDYHNNLDDYKLFEALANVFGFIKKIDVYINEQQPWVLNKNNDPKLDDVLATLLFGIKFIAGFLDPFMPNKMEEAKKHIDKMEMGQMEKGEKLGLFERMK